jgi:hypothetical protein
MAFKARSGVELEVSHYRDRPGELPLHDDGKTCEFDSGEHSWTKLRAARDANDRWLGKGYA